MLVQIASCFTLKSRGEIIFSFIICNRQNRPDRICAQILVYCRWACRQISGRSVQYSTSWPVMKLLWETFVDCKPTRTRKTPRADNVDNFIFFRSKNIFSVNSPKPIRKKRRKWFFGSSFLLFHFSFWSNFGRKMAEHLASLSPFWNLTGRRMSSTWSSSPSRRR